jgi:hypothetical protein
MNREEKKPTFDNPLYYKKPKFLSYFVLIVLLTLFSIYLIKQLIDPNGIFFIQIAIIITGIYLASIILRMKKILML